MDTPSILHTEMLTADSDTTGTLESQRQLAVLHGIYGAGRNWKSVARAILRARPTWDAMLVDLRGHGASLSIPGPHTIEAAARDLIHTFRALKRRPDVIIGHSFGGKVALEYLRLTAAAGTPPSQTWVIDSTPEPRPPSGSAWEMIELLRQVPGPFSSRSVGVAALEAHGVARPVAQWMSTNLVEQSPDEWGWRLDLDVMEALLIDFFARDLWEVVETPPNGAEVHLVKATESNILSGAALSRAEAAAASASRLFLHVVPGGHWLNADNPYGLVERMLDGMR